MATWRLILDPPREGGLNMAIDQALLRAAEERPDVPQTVLRIYKWVVPTLSLGYAQKPEEVADLDFCRRAGVPLVRRPTGGRAVLHDQELTYAVVSNDPQVFRLRSGMEIYRQIARALQSGLDRIGLRVTLSEGADRARAPARVSAAGNYLRTRGPCFISPARHELLCGGKKIVGSAQRRLRFAFLQHGSLLLDGHFPFLAAVTRTDEAHLRAAITTVRAERGETVPEGDVIAGLCQGFSNQFGIRFADAPLSAEELTRAGDGADAYRIFIGNHR